MRIAAQVVGWIWLVCVTLSLMYSMEKGFITIGSWGYTIALVEAGILLALYSIVAGPGLWLVIWGGQHNQKNRFVCVLARMLATAFVSIAVVVFAVFVVIGARNKAVYDGILSGTNRTAIGILAAIGIVVAVQAWQSLEIGRQKQEREEREDVSSSAHLGGHSEAEEMDRLEAIYKGQRRDRHYWEMRKAIVCHYEKDYRRRHKIEAMPWDAFQIDVERREP